MNMKEFLSGNLGVIGVTLLSVYLITISLLTVYGLLQAWPVDGEGSIKFLAYSIDANLEARLALLAILSGSLGSVIHATTSFTTFLGNRQLLRSWVGWYYLRPLIGMALGLLFYFVIRAGFVTTGQASAVNPFGIAAIAGLAGMFSKQATDKLKELFDQLFASSQDAQRNDKLDQG